LSAIAMSSAMSVFFAVGTLDVLQVCDLTVVGGGPGGIYFAWRLLTSEAAGPAAGSVCLFERSGRFGGRIFSLRNQGPEEDLVVDLGAYRYAPEPYQESTWYIYTPLLGALIDNALKIPSAPYEPGNPNSTLRKIIDMDGQNAGYATFVETMVEKLKGLDGFKMQFNEELVAIQASQSGGRIRLDFASGLTVSTGKVLLNLPQLPLLKVLDNSEGLFDAAGVPPALQVPTPMDGVKLYVHYTNAWWRNILNLTSGSFGLDMHNATTKPLTQLPDLSGRYHDGHTRCSSSPQAACRGFLEATYTYANAARFFLTHEPNNEPPYTRLQYSQPTGKFALDLVHDVLVGYHKTALDKVRGYNATRFVSELRPDFALLSYWGPQTRGYGGAIHSTRIGPLLKESELAPLAMAPFSSKIPVFIANEAFGALRGSDGVLGGHHGWAECSLVMAENILAEKFNVPPPSWINVSIYDEYVRFHYDKAERTRRGGWSQG